MQEVTLIQMLEARENRVCRQYRMLKTFRQSLVCFTMNIPGPIKNTPLIRRAFRYGCQRLEECLNEILSKETIDAVTGFEALYAVKEDPLKLKKICTAIEEETPLGRLFDMDVLDIDGNKLDRTQAGGSSRDCIVCGAPGRTCASRRMHSVPELQTAVNRIMQAHFLQRDAEYIAALAVESLLDEVSATPKPGLVDRRNNGSHRDMDLGLFTDSAHALRPYFQDCFLIGQETGDLAPDETFYRLRQAGIGAEQTMLQATGGVNTHKGAVFTLGILCGSLGRLWSPENPIPETTRILAECAGIAAVSLKEDFTSAPPAPRTAGERLYWERGITGIRGECAAGLPSVANISLPVFHACLSEGASQNDSGITALLHLIATVEDTNLYHRGGVSGAQWAKDSAAALLPRPSIAQLEALDDAFIRRNLSPGGCADLLAVTLFLHKLQRTPD